MANFDVTHYATGGAYYYRLVRKADGYIWNNVAQAWAAVVSWGDSAVAITETPGVGDYPFVIPAGIGRGSGRCNLIMYTQAGGSAANTDAIKEKSAIDVGSIFGF